MKIGDFSQPYPVTVTREESLQVAAQRMREHHVGDVVVVEPLGGRSRPVGMLTDRDIVIEVLAPGLDPLSVNVGDVMSTRLVTTTVDSTMDEVIELMHSEGVRRVPVVDDSGALVTVISIDDLLGLVAAQAAQLYSLVLRGREREVTSRNP
ncbi:MAG: CBS domain-containing protein [Gammaproteobacteria bacterium]